MSNFLFAFVCAWIFLSILFFCYVYNWFSFEYLSWSPYLYWHCFRGFGFWVEISINYFILFMAYEVSLFFWRKIKTTTYVFQPRDKFLFGILYINLLYLKGFIWFWSRIWGFYKFGSFKSWGFWYLRLIGWS